MKDVIANGLPAKREIVEKSGAVAVVPVKDDGKIVMVRQYRVAVQEELLEIPAGLMDPEDADAEQPLFETARRELMEEAGLALTEKDRISIVNPLLFSSPGMTDESNAIVCVVVERDGTEGLSQTGAVGQEKFDGFVLTDLKTAKKYLKEGRDADGIFYSVYTWIGLMWFVSGMWKD